MKIGFSQSDIITTAKSLGLPTDGFIQRRIARALDLLQSNKVDRIDDDLFRVHSQYEPNKHYIVNVNHGHPSCDCPDGKRTIWCKHQIAARLFAQKQPRFKICDDTENSYLGRGRWIVYDYAFRKGYVICRNSKGELECPCFKENCIHRKIVNDWIANNGKRIVNECGTQEAKKLQDKLNAQHGDEESPSLDPTDPFQEAELLDIAQIEGRRNGDLVHKLSNGEYVISYCGIMHLAKKHGIEFTVKDNDDTIIAYAQLDGAKRVSGKPVKVCGSVLTAAELAKRSAARQLLPYPEIKALEKKAQLEAEFSFQKAKAKCLELVPKFKLDIAIHDLVQAGKLEQKHPSDYDRIEWLMIYRECKKDAEINGNDDNKNDGGDDSPSSEWKVKLSECISSAKNFRRYETLKRDLQHEGVISNAHPKEWDDKDFAKLKEACELDKSLFSKKLEYWQIEKEPHEGVFELFGKYDFCLTPLHDRCFWCEVKDVTQDCIIRWGRYRVKTGLCLECKPKEEELTEKFDRLYYNESKRKLIMDRKKNITLVETDGTERPMTIQDVAFTFGGNVVMKLTQGIQIVGADISKVEVD